MEERLQSKDRNNEVMPDETLIKHLDLDVTGVSAAAPLLPRQTLRVRVGEAGLKQTEKGLRRVVIPLTLEEPGRDLKGNTVQVGFRITHSFLVDESGGWSKERGAQELLRCKMAILGIDEDEAKSTPHNFDAWAGREVMAVTDVKGENQNVSRLIAIR